MNHKLGLRKATAVAALAGLVATSAFAQTPAPAAPPPEPDWTFSGNVGLFSEYVFRGLEQTNNKPALQGGLDLGHKSGFYVGTWATNISWLSDTDPDVSASLEWDWYGGFKFELPAEFEADLGVLYYWYPGTYPDGFKRPNTTELYAALSWKMLSAKYSHSVSDTFGFADSKNSYYVEGNLNWDVVEKVNDVVGKVTLFAHVGYQSFKNNGDFSYTDWKVGASTEIWGLTVGIFGTGTDAESDLYTNRFGRNTAANQFVGYVQKSF